MLSRLLVVVLCAGILVAHTHISKCCDECASGVPVAFLRFAGFLSVSLVCYIHLGALVREETPALGTARGEHLAPELGLVARQEAVLVLPLALAGLVRAAVGDVADAADGNGRGDGGHAREQGKGRGRRGGGSGRRGHAREEGWARAREERRGGAEGGREGGHACGERGAGRSGGARGARGGDGGADETGHGVACVDVCCKNVDNGLSFHPTSERGTLVFRWDKL